VPAVGPYNLCPDIIQSSTAIPIHRTPDTLESWNRMYNAEPAPGDNYYYVRGLNGASSGKFEGAVSSSDPAELILFPSSGSTTSFAPPRAVKPCPSALPLDTSGSRGAIPSAWPTVCPVHQEHVRLVHRQNTAVAIPTISSWIEMSQFMTQQLNFGSRNAKSFDPWQTQDHAGAHGDQHPPHPGRVGNLQFMLTSAGLVGDTLG